MIINDYQNNWPTQDPYGLFDFYVLDYGTGVKDKDLVASAIEPFKLYDTLTKGTVYCATSGTSSEVSVIVPETTWFVNDKSSKVLIFPKKLQTQDDYTWISFSETHPPRWTIEEKYDLAFDRVGQLIKLKKDWDSYGGSAIDEDCIGRAIDILKELIDLRDRRNISLRVPFIAPLSSGGIQMEWEEGERYLELLLTPGSLDVGYFASDRTGVGELSLEGSMKSIRNIEDLILWFMNGEARDLGSINFEASYDELMAA